MEPPLFRDRRAAGRALARRLERYAGPDVLVLGLPRGGVPVAAEVARALGARLDVFVARKVGAPGNPEFAVGAVAPDVVALDEGTIAALRLAPEDVEERVALERREMDRRFEAYRGGGLPDVADRVVVLVDDGVATGSTARAALRSLRRMGPRRLVLAVPVAAPDSLDAIAAECDEAVAVATPEPFRAVGLWYEDFGQTTDDEVHDLLHAPTPRAERIPVEGGALLADVAIPRDPAGLVVFVHGSGSGRASPRNRRVARALQARGLATMLVDLLTADEALRDAVTQEHRFDIALLTERVVAVVDHAVRDPATRGLRLGLLGSSTGAAGALAAAARRPDAVATVVSRGGRPDLGGEVLPDVRAPTLLLVGGLDEDVLRLNEEAAARMTCPRELVLIAGASHLFEEPGTLDEAAAVAGEWLRRHLAPPTALAGTRA